MKTFVPGEKLYAKDLNESFGELGDDVTLTYNDDGSIATAKDNKINTTHAFTYADDMLIQSYTDGTNTWTLTWDSDRTHITRIIKT